MSRTTSDTDLLALRGLQISAQNQTDFGQYLRWLERIAPGSTAALHAIHVRPAGLSVIVPVSAKDWPHDLLNDLAAQDASPDSFEVILVDRRFLTDGDDEPPRLPFRLSVCHAPRAGFGAACNAGLDAAGRSQITILQEDCRLSTGFVSGLLAVCGQNAIALAQIGVRGQMQNASDRLELCRQRHFRLRSELTSDQSVTLAPVLLSSTGKVFPALYGHFIRFDEARTGHEIAIFWAETVAVFHPMLRTAGERCIHLTTGPDTEASRMREAPEGVQGPFLAALELQRIARSWDHPILNEAMQILIDAARDWLGMRPDRMVEGLHEARRIGIPADLIDRAFHDLCLTGIPEAQAPSISIIVPVRNTADYLDRCLSSILAQTLTDFELLLINDASTDNSLDVLLEYARKDARVRVFTHARLRGPGGARNTGLRHARGDYISFIDSDDHVATGYLSSLYEGAEEGRFDIVVCGAARITEDGTVIGKIDSDVRRMDPIPHDADILTLITPALWNKLWRASMFAIRDPFFPEGMYFQDSARVPGLVARARAINRIGTVLYFYVERAGNISCSYGDKHMMDYLRMFEIVKQDLVDQGKYDIQKDRFAAWIAGHMGYHERHVSRLHQSDDLSAYVRHLQILKRGYQEMNEDLWHQGEAHNLNMLLRHSELA